MAEINEQKNNLMKHFFEKINNIDKPLAKLKQKRLQMRRYIPKKSTSLANTLKTCIFSPKNSGKLRRNKVECVGPAKSTMT